MPRPLPSTTAPRSSTQPATLLELEGVSSPPERVVAARIGRRGVLAGLIGTAAVVATGCDAAAGSPAASSTSGQGASPAAPGTSGAAAASSRSASAPATQHSSATTRSTAPGVDWSGVRSQLQTSAALFAGAATKGLKGTTPAFRSWATAAASMSAQQVARLALADPLSGASATPVPVSPARLASMAQAATRLAAQQQALSTYCVRLATQAGNADEALLLVSLAAAAHASAAPGPAPTASPLPPAHAEVGSRTDALQVLLSHLEAAIEGYERGAGRLAVTDTTGLDNARARINQLSALRDATQSSVVAAGATPAPPVLGYAMPGAFTSIAAIHQTWGHLELALLDAWARVAAASTGRDRSAAIARALSQADAARGLGVGVSTWPGWSVG